MTEDEQDGWRLLCDAFNESLPTPADDFTKHDHDKPEMYLIPPRALLEMSKALTYGAKKYSPDNWRKLPREDRHRYVSAAMRHMNAYRRGERLDDETDLHHLAHAMCCLAFLVELELKEQ